MTEIVWIGLNAGERAVVLNALAALRRSNADEVSEIDALTIKIVHSATIPTSRSVFTVDRCNGH